MQRSFDQLAKRGHKFLRISRIPPNGRSMNFATGFLEEGVSVWDVEYLGKGYWNVLLPKPYSGIENDGEYDENDEPIYDENGSWKGSWSTDAHETFDSHTDSRKNDPVYIVTGEVIGIGQDGEALLRDVKIVREIDWDHVVCKERHFHTRDLPESLRGVSSRTHIWDM